MGTIVAGETEAAVATGGESVPPLFWGEELPELLLLLVLLPPLLAGSGARWSG